MGKEFYITSDQAGRRVDRFLRTMWPQVPLSAIMRALRKGEVRLDAKRATPDTRLQEGQFLQVPWNDIAPISIPSEYSCLSDSMHLNTIYKDDYVWIVNKPAGLLTQPDTRGGDSLITRALNELKWSRVDFRPSTVQRLDRNTSGLVMVALGGVSLRCLSELVRDRKIKKIYRAVVLGDIAESGEISFSLLKNTEDNTVKADKNGQSALTRYKKLGGNGSLSTVEIELVTGRSHQARVHLAEIGHVILGDRKYGDESRKVKRPLLHAYSVSFPDEPALPETLRGKSFKAPLPCDMVEYFQ